MKKIIPSLVIMLFTSINFTILKAQTGECGVPPLTQAEVDSFIQNPISTPVASGITFNVPVEIIVFRDDNGTLPQGFTEELLFDNFVLVNEWYFTHGIQFYICKISYFNDSRYFDFFPNQVDDQGPGFTELGSVFQLYPVTEAIPIYISDILRSPDPVRGAAPVPVPGISAPSWVGIGGEGIQIPSTYAHELGHYLGLQHTHHLISGESLAPPGTSACASTGDLICDTPVDPRNCPVSQSSGNCFLGSCQKMAGDGNTYSYNPDINNIMSYYSQNCRTRFSTEQGEVMRSILTTHQSRDFLVDSNFPSCSNYVASTGIMQRVNKDAGDNFLLFPFDNSKVDINNLTLSSSCQETANSSGNYTLDFCVPVAGYIDANLKPLKEDIANNEFDYDFGVTAFDLIKITQHIQSVQELPKPYGWIAADVNRSGSVSIFDYIKIQKVILNTATSWENSEVGSWAFVPEYYLDSKWNFESDFESNPFTATWQGNGETRPYDPSSGQKSYLDDLELYTGRSDATKTSSWSFYGIKMGDVNFSAFSLPSGNFTENEPLNSYRYNVKPHNSIKQGKKIKLDLVADCTEELLGYQLLLKFDPSAIKVENIKESKAHKLDMEKFGLTNLAKGIIKTLWVDEKLKTLKLKNAKSILSLEITALKDIDNMEKVIWLDNDRNFKSEFYGAENSNVFVNLDLEVKNADIKASDNNFELNIFPNPVTDELKILIKNAKANELEIFLTDKNNRRRRFSRALPIGSNEIILDDFHDLAKGPIHYTIILGTKMKAGTIIKL